MLLDQNNIRAVVLETFFYRLGLFGVCSRTCLGLGQWTRQVKQNLFFSFKTKPHLHVAPEDVWKTLGAPLSPFFQSALCCAPVASAVAKQP